VARFGGYRWQTVRPTEIPLLSDKILMEFSMKNFT
jgi:hypothetical protein